MLTPAHAATARREQSKFGTLVASIYSIGLFLRRASNDLKNRQAKLEQAPNFYNWIFVALPLACVNSTERSLVIIHHCSQQSLVIPRSLHAWKTSLQLFATAASKDSRFCRLSSTLSGKNLHRPRKASSRRSTTGSADVLISTGYKCEHSLERGVQIERDF